MTPEELATELERLSASARAAIADGFSVEIGRLAEVGVFVRHNQEAIIAALKGNQRSDAVLDEFDTVLRRLADVNGWTRLNEIADTLATLRRQLAERDAENQRLRDALTVAQGRLYWCGAATPGCADKAGRKLALEWSEETGRALENSHD